MLRTAGLWHWFRGETFHVQLAYTLVHAVPKNLSLFIKFKVSDEFDKNCYNLNYYEDFFSSVHHDLIFYM